MFYILLLYIIKYKNPPKWCAQKKCHIFYQIKNKIQKNGVHVIAIYFIKLKTNIQNKWHA